MDGGLVVVATPGIDVAEGLEAAGKAEERERGGSSVAEDAADRKSWEGVFPRGQTPLLPHVQDLCLPLTACPTVL